jgi:hypothetical protein
MIHTFASLPGQLLGFGRAHAFWSAVAGIVLLSAGYYGALHIYHAYVAAKDVRNRRL